MSLLDVENLSVSYGKTTALRSVSLRAQAGSVTCVLGANGAGKSTLFKSIMGLVPKGAGTVRFDGDDISKLPTYDVVRRGITLCPEGRRLFPEMTVGENVRMGAVLVRDRRKLRERTEFVYELFPRVRQRLSQQASSLSGGEQQMVAIARALMGGPRLLLLDEPTLGLAPKLIQEVGTIVTNLRREGFTVILVEQNANLALRVSDHAYLLETGDLVMSGPSETILGDVRVQKAYLGG